MFIEKTLTKKERIDVIKAGSGHLLNHIQHLLYLGTPYEIIKIEFAY